jgi:hypothetical protein
MEELPPSQRKDKFEESSLIYKSKRAGNRDRCQRAERHMPMMVSARPSWIYKLANLPQ